MHACVLFLLQNIRLVLIRRGVLHITIPHSVRLIQDALVLVFIHLIHFFQLFLMELLNLVYVLVEIVVEHVETLD